MVEKKKKDHKKLLMLIAAFLLSASAAALGSSVSRGPLGAYNIAMMPMVGVLSFLLAGKRWYLSPATVLFTSGVWLTSSAAMRGDGFVAAVSGALTASCTFALLCMAGVAVGGLSRLALSAGNHGTLLRAASGVCAAAIAIVIASAANMMTGNPFSRSVAQMRFERYVAINYPQFSMVISKARYDFESSSYNSTAEPEDGDGPSICLSLAVPVWSSEVEDDFADPGKDPPAGQDKNNG